MKDLKLYTSLVYLFVLCSNVAAQQPFSKKVDIEEENLTLKANVLLKDHNGFLWVGTSEGLFKYNSSSPEKIYIPGTEKIYINALFEDKKTHNHFF
jgi:ligand-binding sensor domain-containing protein